MKNIYISDHPLVKHKLSIARDKDTRTPQFKKLLSEVTYFIGIEATRDLPLKKVTICTPVIETIAERLSGVTPFLVPIMRAGIVMIEPMQELLPTSKVGFIGLFRKEDSLFEKVEVEKYYCKLPEDGSNRSAIVLDPMLATGVSGSMAITVLKKAGVKDIKFVCIVACPVGIKKITEDHPDVKIFCAALDEGLNEYNYIVPGLGDAGDRIYGTK
jgi:uracil phosphoribosyltransferase